MKLVLLLALAVLMPLTYAGRTRPRLPLIRELVRKNSVAEHCGGRRGGRDRHCGQ